MSTTAFNIRLVQPALHESAAGSPTSGPAPSSGALPDASSREAIEAAYDRAASSLYRYVFVRVRGDRALCADLMQQLWLAACERGGGGGGASRVPPGELEFWFRGVLKNLLASHWRREGVRGRALPAMAGAALSRQVAHALEQGGAGAQSILERAELREALLHAITELPAEDQDLLIEHYLLARPHGALAAARATSERAIEGRLYRARCALRAKLNSLH